MGSVGYVHWRTCAQLVILGKDRFSEAPLANSKRTTFYRRALRQATPTVSDVARQMGMHRNTVSGYLNRLPPSRAATEALVKWLRRHAADLMEQAERLEGVER